MGIRPLPDDAQLDPPGTLPAGVTALPDTAQLDDQNAPASTEDVPQFGGPPSIQSQIGGPPIVIVGKRNPRLDNPRYTDQGFQSGGVRPDTQYHSSLSDADKKEYEGFFTDKKKPPAAAFLKQWLKDKTGADFGNADLVIKHFKQTGKFSTDQQILTPTKDQGASQTAGEHFTTGAVPFVTEALAAPMSLLGINSDPNRPTVWNSDLPLSQLWAQNADIEHAQLERDSNAHPVAALLGQMAGMAATAPVGTEATDALGLAKLGERFGEVPRQIIGQSAVGALQGSSAAGPGHRLEGAAEGAATVPAIAGVTALPFAGIRKLAQIPQSAEAIARDTVIGDIKADALTPEQWAQTLENAHTNEVPMIPADAGPNARGRLAAASRVPGEGRKAAQDALEARQETMGDRIVGHIQRDLGEVVNPLEQRKAMMDSAKAKAGPLFADFHSQPPVADETIDNILGGPRADVMKPVLNEARDLAAWEGEDTKAMGMRQDENGNVVLEPGPRVRKVDENGNVSWEIQPPVSQEEMAASGEGRWQNVEGPDPLKELTVRTHETATGRKVSVRGPLDVTQTLRLWGGLKDPVVQLQKRLGKGFKKFTNRGDFKSIGLGGKPRQLEFGGNEQMIGKLVNNKDGMDLDDAAQRITEAGFFPDRKEPLTPNDLLEILADEDHGRARYFHPNNTEEVERFNAAQSNRDYLRQLDDEGTPASEDPTSHAGEGPPQAPPAPGREPVQEMTYTPKTLDYVKRGLDSLIEKEVKNPDTGELTNKGRVMANTRRQLMERADQLYPQWKPARDVWGGEQAGMEAMDLGLKKVLDMPADELRFHMKNMSEYERQMLELGARRAMAVRIGKKGDTTDFVHALIGGGEKRRLLKELFGNKPTFDRFVDSLYQEREGYRTFKKAFLGSPTASNLADDQAMGNLAAEAATLLATGHPGAAIIKGIASKAGKIFATERGKRVQQEIARLLTNKDPAALRAMAAELTARGKTLERRAAGRTRARTAIGAAAIPVVGALRGRQPQQ